VQWLTVNVGTAVILVVMLTAPLGLRTAAERARFWLDAATVMAATAGFGAYFTIAPEAISPSASHLLRWVQEVVLGPVIFLVGVFVVVKLLYGGAPPFTRSCAALLGTTAAMQGWRSAWSRPFRRRTRSLSSTSQPTACSWQVPSCSSATTVRPDGAR